jgi:hypothetical protein
MELKEFIFELKNIKSEFDRKFTELTKRYNFDNEFDLMTDLENCVFKTVKKFFHSDFGISKKELAQFIANKYRGKEFRVLRVEALKNLVDQGMLKEVHGRYCLTPKAKSQK